MNEYRRNIERMNPYIVYTMSGELKRNAQERMCLWYEIELVDGSGDGGVYTLDQFLPADHGVIYIRKPGMIVRGIAPYAYRGIQFDAVYDPEFEEYYQMRERSLSGRMDVDFLRKMQARGDVALCLEELPPRIVVRNPERYSALFENAFHHYMENRESFQLYARCELLQIITMLMDEVQQIPADGDSARMRGIHSVRRYLDRSYPEQIDLAVLARRASMSREYLCRSFKRAFGQSPMEYLTSVRLFHARRELVTTDRTIAEIVANTGFSSEQYFYRIFHRRFGCSPAQYRRGKPAIQVASDLMKNP